MIEDCDLNSGQKKKLGLTFFPEWCSPNGTTCGSVLCGVYSVGQCVVCCTVSPQIVALVSSYTISQRFGHINGIKWQTKSEISV